MKEEEEDLDSGPVVHTKELVQYVSVIKSGTNLNYRRRYLSRPFDPLVVFMAMISKFPDLDAADREIASVWLRLWDDASLGYKALIKRGHDYVDL